MPCLFAFGHGYRLIWGSHLSLTIQHIFAVIVFVHQRKQHALSEELSCAHDSCVWTELFEFVHINRFKCHIMVICVISNKTNKKAVLSARSIAIGLHQDIYFVNEEHDLFHLMG